LPDSQTLTARLAELIAASWDVAGSPLIVEWTGKTSAAKG
jgi:hypothetical protein